MSNVKDLQAIFGEVLFEYSRKQALEDGVLVDLNQIIPIHESGYKFPVACTVAVWAIIDTAVKNPKHCNDYKGVVWDILHMSRNYQTERWESGCMFKVINTGAGPKETYRLKIECGPGDEGEPVLTIMLPDED
jgi:hypothetical protein